MAHRRPTISNRAAVSLYSIQLVLDYCLLKESFTPSGVTSSVAGQPSIIG